MPRGIRAAGCAVNPVSSSCGSQHIWISDDLLATTFRNFTHRHRRYGSNVPGPLEARRRAAKRKNTNLAHHAPPLIDPSILLGAGPQHGWWQKSDPPTTKPPPSLLPTWLFEPAHKDIQRSRETTLIDEEWAEYSIQKEEQLQEARLERELRRQLQQNYKNVSVRELVDRLEINLRQHPRLATAAFDSFLQVYWKDNSSGTNILQEFLTDPILNPPGTSHHLVLLQELCKKPVSRKSWETSIFTAVQNAVKLGMVSIEDLREIIKLLPTVHQTSGLAAIREGEKLVSDYHRLLTAIEESKILSLQDIGFESLNTLYQRLVSGIPSDSAVSLLWRLRKFSAREEVDVVAQLLTVKLQYLVKADIAATEKFKSWIITLPQELRGPAVLRTSQSLVTAATEGIIKTSEIERWYETFSSLNEENCVHVTIDKNAWNEALNSSNDLSLGQNLLVLAWTVTYLNTKHIENSKLLASFGFKEQFLRIFSEMSQDSSNDLLGHVVMTLDTLPLPAKDKLYWHLQQFTDKSLMNMLGHNISGEGIESLADCDVIKPDDKPFHQWAKLSTNDKLAKLASIATTDLTAFQNVAQNLIMKNKTTFNIVNQILEHNLPIKLALPYWPNHVALQQEVYGAQPNLDSAKAADLIHHLAISFAVTPAIGPRSAFRYVYRLYIYLHRYGAPINPLMSRALWHAGVTRYGKEGTSNTQLAWCLHKVREIEGPDVANMLLWSAGFRKLRSTELDDYNFMTVSSTKEPELPPVLKNNGPSWSKYREDAKSRVKAKKEQARIFKTQPTT